MNFLPGPMELILILVIVAMLFGVGKLPEVFGAVGKGIKEFRKETTDADKAPPAPAQSTPAPTTNALPAETKAVENTAVSTVAAEPVAAEPVADKVEQA